MAIQHSNDPPPFMRDLNLEAVHAPKFLEYASIASDYVVDGEMCVRMQFNNREVVVQVVKNYIIFRSVDYKVHESELMTIYCKCKHFGSKCQWLVRGHFQKEQGILGD